MAKIKNICRIIKVSQNQDPISFQFSIKTVITFWFIWYYFGYKWGHAQKSRGHNLG